jgi:hypothetical protein
MHEEFVRDSLAGLVSYFEERKIMGEMTLVVAGVQKEK